MFSKRMTTITTNVIKSGTMATFSVRIHLSDWGPPRARINSLSTSTASASSAD